MIRIWGIAQRAQKIQKQAVVEVDEAVGSQEMLYEALELLCKALDIARPVVLPGHESGFAQFGRVKFNRDAFMEPVVFDAFVVEQLREGRKSADIRNQFT